MGGSGSLLSRPPRCPVPPVLRDHAQAGVDQVRGYEAGGVRKLQFSVLLCLLLWRRGLAVPYLNAFYVKCMTLVANTKRAAATLGAIVTIASKLCPSC